MRAFDWINQHAPTLGLNRIYTKPAAFWNSPTARDGEPLGRVPIYR